MSVRVVTGDPFRFGIEAILCFVRSDGSGGDAFFREAVRRHPIIGQKYRHLCEIGAHKEGTWSHFGFGDHHFYLASVPGTGVMDSPGALHTPNDWRHVEYLVHSLGLELLNNRRWPCAWPMCHVMDADQYVQSLSRMFVDKLKPVDVYLFREYLPGQDVSVGYFL